MARHMGMLAEFFLLFFVRLVEEIRKRRQRKKLRKEEKIWKTEAAENQ
jgi:hypothetical protein